MDLTTLAKRINQNWQDGEQSAGLALTKYYQVGLDLVDVKAELAHGQWLPWIKANLRFSKREAQLYLALTKAKSATVAHLKERWQEITGRQRNDQPCDSVEWLTPPNILVLVRQFFGGQIPLDPASPPSSPTQAKRFFTKNEDGLSQAWTGKGVYVNPPYGDALPDWAGKIHEEATRGIRIVALLPCGARFGTSYFQDHILCEELNAICFIRGRMAFTDGTGTTCPANPYDSALYGYNVKDEFERFGSLGRVLLVR